jgi:DNA-binding NarL/FixJ family response regulator
MTTRMSKNATESGAAGFLLKQTSAHDVCRAIREVARREDFFQPRHRQTSG